MAVVAYPSGMLTQSVVVEAQTRERQPDFTDRTIWTPAALPWRVSIRQLNGREQAESQQMKATATHEIKGRYYPGLTSQHRLIFGSRTFNIVSVNNMDEANVNHTLRCREVI